MYGSVHLKVHRGNTVLIVVDMINFEAFRGAGFTYAVRRSELPTLIPFSTV